MTLPVIHLCVWQGALMAVCTDGSIWRLKHDGNSKHRWELFYESEDLTI